MLVVQERGEIKPWRLELRQKELITLFSWQRVHKLEKELYAYV